MNVNTEEITSVNTSIIQINAAIFQQVITTYSAEDFISFYINHTQQETLDKYKIRNSKQLIKILKYFKYDFSIKKPSKLKNRPAKRSHESYLAGGRKSAATQKQNWQKKSKQEKSAWSALQVRAHLTKEFKNKITKTNLRYINSLSKEQRELQNYKRSQSMKTWWKQLTPYEQEEIMTNRFANGRVYQQKDSKPNLEFAAMLSARNINYQREFCLDKKLFDFKVGDLLVEIDPTFTHNSTFSPFKTSLPLDKNYHSEKTKIANKYNYTCIHVFDWENKAKIIDTFLSPRDRLYARQCELKLVNNKLAHEFINKHHLQNYVSAEINLGLFYLGELVSIMTFGRPRYNKNYQFELLRYCSSKNIVGGSEKIFTNFIKLYSPTSIVSYCDLSKFSGAVYSKLNFTLLRKPLPAKHWYNIKTNEHFTDSLLRQQGFSRLVHHCDATKDINLPTNDNKELMIGAGFVEVYDCGQATYVWQSETCTKSDNSKKN